MTKRARRSHTPAFKAKAALAAIKAEKPPAALAQRFDVPPNRTMQRRGQLVEGAAGTFGLGKTEAIRPRRQSQPELSLRLDERRRAQRLRIGRPMDSAVPQRANPVNPS